jgi:NADH-quinone oxidoreductase subunit I
MQTWIHAVKGLWSLIVGLKITGMELVRPTITVHYPRREVDNLETYRGHIELMPLAGDPKAPRCIMCWRCVDICPSRCISLRLHVKGEAAGAGADSGLQLAPDVPAPQSRHLAPPPDTIERELEAFRLNYSLCSLCGLCVQSCPADAIRFSRNAYLVGTQRQAFDIDLLERLRRKTGAVQGGTA